MAYTKAQLEALKNSLLASNQPITASIHRSFAQKLIDELFDAQSRGNILAGVQDSGTTVTGDEVLVIRGGQAYLIPASQFGVGLTLNDLNGVVIVDPQDGDLLAYDVITDTWNNIPNTFVPYAGATANVDLGEFGLRAGFIRFDTTPTGTPDAQGVASWDDATKTIALQMNGVTQYVGQDQFVYVKNSSGADIPKGRAVRNSGTDGASGHKLIAPFLADGTHDSETYLGVTAEAIPNGGFGQVQAWGDLRKVDTSPYPAGSFLYVSTTSAGQFQATAPVAPNNIILVGRAINSKTNGDIFLRSHIGSNINNDEGVRIVSPVNGQALIYNSVTGLWENTTVSEGIYGSLTANYVPKAIGASTVGNSVIFEVNGRILIGKITDSGGTLQIVGSFQLTGNVEVNDSFGLFFDASNRIRMSAAHGWDISSWVRTVFSSGNVVINAGTLSTRASSTNSPATQIPVFSADPATTTREMVTRTPTQLLGDLGFDSEAITASGFTNEITPVQNTEYSYTFSAFNRAAPEGTIYEFEFAAIIIYQNATDINDFEIAVRVTSDTITKLPLVPTAVTFPNFYKIKVVVTRMAGMWVQTIECIGGSFNINSRISYDSIQTSTIFTGTVIPKLGFKTPLSKTVTTGDGIRFYYMNKKRIR